MVRSLVGNEAISGVQHTAYNSAAMIGADEHRMRVCRVLNNIGHLKILETLKVSVGVTRNCNRKIWTTIERHAEMQHTEMGEGRGDAKERKFKIKRTNNVQFEMLTLMKLLDSL